MSAVDLDTRMNSVSRTGMIWAGGISATAMDVVDALIARGMVDSTQMGVTGGSYGGYMTNWTITQTARFKSAVSMYGIFSWFTDWSNFIGSRHLNRCILVTITGKSLSIRTVSGFRVHRRHTCAMW